MTRRPAFRAKASRVEADIGLGRTLTRKFDREARGRLIISSHIEDGAASRVILGPIDRPVEAVRRALGRLFA